ncbi:MAG: hypothetical protein HY775_06000 [Acidobacteria bacterium]|nr:hypothetical protein [Acidobacteriota bacterium]
MGDTRVVLVVEEDDVVRDRLAAWLSEAGFMPLTCAGPLAPEYTCPGGRGEACPLAEFADVAVLDLWLESDTAMVGTPGWQLLPYYIAMGKPVVALATEEDQLHPVPERLVTMLRRLPEKEQLLSAVRALAAEARVARATAAHVVRRVSLLDPVDARSEGAP